MKFRHGKKIIGKFDNVRLLKIDKIKFVNQITLCCSENNYRLLKNGK